MPVRPLLAPVFRACAPRRPRRGAKRTPAARGPDRPAPVLPRRQDEGRAAEGKTQPMHRAVPQKRFLHRPSRRGADVSRAQQGSLYGRGPHGRRHHRMRCDLYKRPPAGLPAFAMRSAHHDQHSRGAGAGIEMHARFQPGRSRYRQESVGQMLHQRHHAGRIQAAHGEDGRRQSGRHQCRRLHERHAALAHRPLRQFRHADDA